MAISTSAPPVPFDVFLLQVEKAAPAVRPALVETFWQRLAQTPVVESSTAAVFLYHGEAGTVDLVGIPGASVLPLRRIDGTELWYRRVRLERAARLEYAFRVDGAGGVLDASNPHRVPGPRGLRSELAMPGYAYPAGLPRDGSAGSADGLDRHALPSGTLSIYLPPDYSRSADRLPTVYFVDGPGYVGCAHAPAMLDRLIGRGEMAPVVAVFAEVPETNDRVAFLADEAAPFVETRYRTQPDAQSRLVVGHTDGARVAVASVLERPDVFGLGVGQSGQYGLPTDDLVRPLETVPVSPGRLYIETGVYEWPDGSGPLAADARDLTASSRRLRAALEARGYEVVYAEHPEGHTWGTWRVHLIDALAHFFPAPDG